MSLLHFSGYIFDGVYGGEKDSSSLCVHQQ